MASRRDDEAVKTVVVVGAGAAGLEASRVLLNHDAYRRGNIKVIVLEARDRVGGRIYIDRKWGVPFDHGANWIHGTLLNPLLPLAKITSSQLTFPDESRQMVFTGSGEVLAPDLSHFLYERIWSYAAEAVEYSADPDEVIPCEWSMHDFCMARISEDEDLDDETKVVALEMMEMLTTFTAVNIRKQSLRHYQVEAELPGERPFVASTYEPILEHLAHPSWVAEVVHLSTPVSGITLHRDRISVSTPSTSLEANAVILAVPLGCLQHSTITFTPSLPQRIHSALTNLGFGNLEKVFLKFNTAWWINPSSLDAPDVYTFLSPTSLPPSAPKQLLTMFSLARLPVHAQPVLAVYLADAWTGYLASKTPADIAQLFQTHYLPSMPNYGPDCVIVDVARTSWATDPWTYGSYTHVPVGSAEGVEDLWVLGEKIVGLEGGVGGLWFAGEHAGMGDMGTVNGALTSGHKAAVEVLREFDRAREQVSRIGGSSDRH